MFLASTSRAALLLLPLETFRRTTTTDSAAPTISDGAVRGCIFQNFGPTFTRRNSSFEDHLRSIFDAIDLNGESDLERFFLFRGVNMREIFAFS